MRINEIEAGECLTIGERIDDAWRTEGGEDGQNEENHERTIESRHCDSEENEGKPDCPFRESTSVDVGNPNRGQAGAVDDVVVE